MDISRIEGYRKFCNKLWNATKFCLFRFGLVDLEGKRQPGASFTPNASDLPTGKESLVEKWLFHKYNAAIAAVNEALEAREFADASSAAYSFFLYDLCDVYIEATKPLFESDADESAKLSAQNTLYTCLEGGLKLLHPFMPYVTEDLWQRLPRRAEDTCETIMLASFPEKVRPYQSVRSSADVQTAQYDFPEAASDFDLTFEAIRAARSVVGLYNLPTNGKTIEDKITVVIQAKNAAQKTMLESQRDIIIALTKGCGTCLFVSQDSEVPTGCGTEIVSTEISVHVVVQVSQLPSAGLCS